MLNKKELIKKVDSHLGAMIEQVNIPNFTKCIAQYAGLKVKDVPDKVIEKYLVMWAENKHRFFNMLGNKLQKDITINYQNPQTGLESEAKSLMTEFPAYAPWIAYLRGQKKNKIEDIYRLSWEARELISTLFPTFNLEGSTITHLFASYLKAPDALVTAIGRAFEGGSVQGTWTLSIDPVDMMLASENPYDWNSCYRLATSNEASHADGCLAAILDDSSLISYIWGSQGDMQLYDHTLVDVRWKRIREWIAISPEMDAIHFNNIYPTKHSYGSDFEKQLRSYTEQIVADFTGVRDSWRHNTGSTYCEREFYYGYGEFSEDNIWCHSDVERPQSWTVYNRRISCPCGCGMSMPGSDEMEHQDYYDNDELYYTGEGFICENFSYRHYCEYSDDYCSVEECCEENCRGCSCWDNAHPYCDIAESGGEGRVVCENPSHYYSNDGYMEACSGHCDGCPMWALHHAHSYEEVNAEPEEEQEAQEQPETQLADIRPGQIIIGSDTIPHQTWTVNTNDIGLTYTNSGNITVTIPNGTEFDL